MKTLSSMILTVVAVAIAIVAVTAPWPAWVSLLAILVAGALAGFALWLTSEPEREEIEPGWESTYYATRGDAFDRERK